MKIGIDGYEANISKRVGIGQYAYQLLQQFATSDGGHEFTIFCPVRRLRTCPKKARVGNMSLGGHNLFGLYGNCHF
jgi:hypothetical protein